MEELRAEDPKSVGDYRLLSRIGSGGMGVVYLATDPVGRMVALKLVRPELADDAVFRPRFRQEVQAGQRVSGVCTARYLDADVESARPYLVTEYVEGGNLADYVAANGPLHGDQIVGLAVGLSEAIVAIHASGVIHRDLKPSNVLMSAKGPKVVDFGISHAVDGTAITQTGVVIGSPSWMAPEQAQGRTVTPAADVFSWGATVAFAATGRPPFGEGRPDALVYRVVHEEPDLSGVDEHLRPLVVKALAKEPTARPTADNLLVGVVKSAMGGQVPTGNADTMTTIALDRTWHQPVPKETWWPPNRKQFLWGAAAIIVIAAFIGAAMYVAHGDGNKPHGSANESSRTISSTAVTSVSTTTTTTVLSSSALTSAFLPLVTCPTTYASIQNTTPSTLPSTMSVSVPQSLVNRLAVYSDQGGGMKLVAPIGWTCSASYGGDGGGGVSVVPPGQQTPGDSLPPSSTAQAVVGSETSACASCREGQACPLFTSAANDIESDYQMPCPTSRPPSESVVPLNANVVSFEDPPGVSGDGKPSGGAYAANGVMTYYPEGSPNADNGSWLETCVLPDSEKAICTTALDRFIDWYGNN